MSDEQKTRAIDELAQASTATALAAAHRRARAAILKARRTLSPNTKLLIETLDMRRQMKADGASDADINAGLELTLREIWPNVREWKYECSRCNDTGLVMQRCTATHRCDGHSTRVDHWRDTPGKYRRLCTTPSASYEHDYGVPCWCQRGARFQATPQSTDSGADISKAAKSRKMARFGDR